MSGASLLSLLSQQAAPVDNLGFCQILDLNWFILFFLMNLRSLCLSSSVLAFLVGVCKGLADFLTGLESFAVAAATSFLSEDHVLVKLCSTLFTALCVALPSSSTSKSSSSISHPQSHRYGSYAIHDSCCALPWCFDLTLFIMPRYLHALYASLLLFVSS